ncbi:MAG TPA: hypothetical protein VM840_08195 [Actinomycetota bacterium]|nr:hypothetical protein [Actinomycetota bacterium]
MSDALHRTRVHRAAAAVLCTAALLPSACTGGGPTGGIDPAADAAARPVSAQAGAILFTRDLATGGQLLASRGPTGQIERIRRLAPNERVSSSGGLLLVTTDRRPELGQGHFEADPHVTIHDGRGRPILDLGRAVAADVEAGGRRVVYATPSAVHTCAPDEEGCAGVSATISVRELGGEHDPVELGSWDDVLGVRWGEKDAVLLERSRENLLVRMGAAAVQGPPGKILQTIPRSGQVLTAQRGHRVLTLAHADGRVLWETDYMPARADGRVSPDGSRLIVQETRARDGGDAETRLSIVTPGRAPHHLEEGRADGELHWTPDGSVYTYRRTSPRGGFELVACRASDDRCHPVWAWREPIQIIHLMGRGT